MVPNIIANAFRAILSSNSFSIRKLKVFLCDAITPQTTALEYSITKYPSSPEHL